MSHGSAPEGAGAAIALTESVVSPLQSLGLKLLALALTVGLVAWVGWPVEEIAAPPADPSGPAPAPTMVAAGRPSVPATTAVVRRTPPASARQVDLNRATAAQLEGLPGVGPVLAQRMIAHRQARGGFSRLEDLLEVKGIGRKRLEQLRPLLTVGPGTPVAATRTPS